MVDSQIQQQLVQELAHLLTKLQERVLEFACSLAATRPLEESQATS